MKAIRLLHQPTGRRFIVKDGHVYEDLDRNGVITSCELAPEPEPALAAADSLARLHDVSYSVGAVVNAEWRHEGTLSAAELRELEKNSLPVTRTALERHLDFFDSDTRDGVISLRENWHGWRRLGYGWLRSLKGAVGAAVVFGRPFSGFSIDIANIRKKRGKATGIYDETGNVNTALLARCLTEFDRVTRELYGAPDRNKPIPQNDALQIITTIAVASGHTIGTVSSRQFGSLFELCARLNHGRKEITANQLESLFDGSLLYMAASVPGPNGRTRFPTSRTHSPLVVTLTVVLIALACVPRPGDGHTLLALLKAAVPVLGAWVVAHFLPNRTALERTVILSLGILLSASLLGGLALKEWLMVWPLIAVAAVVALAQQRRPVVQYVVFCRYPLLLALSTMAVPFIAAGPADTLFKSMLALHVLSIGVVVLLTVLAAQVFVKTASLIANQAPRRFTSTVEWKAPGEWIDRWAAWLTAAIAAPLSVTLVVYAEARTWAAAVAALVGAAAAVLFVIGVKTIGSHDAVKRRTSTVRRYVERHLQERTENVRAGYVGDDGTLLAGHLASAGFLALTLGLYVAGYWLLMPGRFLLPALAYVVLMLIVLGWVLPTVSFFADKFRVSTIVALGALPVLLYFINDIDHYFDVERRPAQLAAPTENDVRTAFAARLARATAQGQEPVIIAVAAGGGGGSAAFWTTRVLAGLHHDNGGRFTDSIHMLSSVSGGSIGALYFIDSLDTSAPADDALATARHSTLEPIAWGLAYPDLWRFFSIRPPNPLHDRGWAFEEALDREVRHHGARLSEWRADMVAGRKPAVLFNATASETGERIVLSPLHFIDRNALTLDRIYGNESDLRTVTAARLSATFPWVTPLAKARGRRSPKDSFHIGDGGYYDNAGVVTLIEWARQAIELARTSGVRKMLFVNIRVSDQSPAMQNRAGWALETVGPILTMLNVRGSSQTSRNAVDMELFSQLPQTTDVKPTFVSFSLSTRTSVSWRLADADFEAIDAYWNTDPGIQKARKTVTDFMAPSSATH